MNINDLHLLSDSHLHLLEMMKKNINIFNFLNEWKQNNGEYLIDIGIDEYDFNTRLNFSRNNSFLFHSSGIHPNNSEGNMSERMKTIEEQLQNDKVVAIGETGLDYYWKNIDPKIQKDFFLKHIELAIKYQKPIIIHNRDACRDVLEILSKYKGKINGIIHCFSSTPKYMKEFVDLGFYISFAGNLTYKKNTVLQSCISQVPLNKLLVETDSPYLSPQPVRGKTNTPLNVIHTFNFIAEHIDIDLMTLKKQLDFNIKEIFKIGNLNDRII